MRIDSISRFEVSPARATFKNQKPQAERFEAFLLEIMFGIGITEQAKIHYQYLKKATKVFLIMLVKSRI